MRTWNVIVLCILIASPALAQRRRATNPAPSAPSSRGSSPAAGDSLSGLTAEQKEAFADGLEDFTEIETVDDGLGPVFNERSCTACHSVPAVGGGSARFVTRFGRTTSAGFDALASLGGSLVQDHAIGPADGSPHEFKAEMVPPSASVVIRRRSTPLFGLGFVDATPDSVFVALAQTQAARGDGVAGRVGLVDNIRAGMKTVGKFGWKAQVPTLLQFSGDAYLNELGITSPDFPNENCPQGLCSELAHNPAPGINDDGGGVDALHAYMTFLAAPPRGRQDRDADDGEALFERLGCNTCHVATLRTGPSDVAALDRKAFHPYSDFLLHDMGSLGDGVVMGDARGPEMRTAPLWGLRFVTAYLHDGRAATLEQAILAHDGQARPARDRYAALSANLKAKVTAFLNSL